MLQTLTTMEDIIDTQCATEEVVVPYIKGKLAQRIQVLYLKVLHAFAWLTPLDARCLKTHSRSDSA